MVISQPSEKIQKNSKNSNQFVETIMYFHYLSKNYFPLERIQLNLKDIPLLSYYRFSNFHNLKLPYASNSHHTLYRLSLLRYQIHYIHSNLYFAPLYIALLKVYQ